MKNLAYPIFAAISGILIIITFMQLPQLIPNWDSVPNKPADDYSGFVILVVLTFTSLFFTLYFRAKWIQNKQDSDTDTDTEPTSSKVYRFIAIALLSAILLYLTWAVWRSF